MSLAAAGQPDTYQSLRSTPEVEVNSLQLTNQHAPNASSPNLKSESPITNDILFSGSPQILETKENKQELSIHDTSVSVVTVHDSSTSPIERRAIPGDSIQSPPQTTINKLNINRSKSVDITTPSTLDSSKVSAYARLEFENFIFYVQTLQVVLGRKSEHDNSHSVDVHLGASKAISRKHAKIFYNFGTERFELSIQGKNGAFVDDAFIESGATVPLINKSKIQIGQIVFRFVLPGVNHQEKIESPSKAINPSDAISLRSTLYTNHKGDTLLDEESNDATPPLTSKDFEPVKTGTSIERSSTNASLTSSTHTAPNDPSSLEADSTATIEKPIVPLRSSSVPSATVLNAVSSIPRSESDTISKKSKEKKVPKPPKPPKKVYTIDEIPEEYRTKPACSYSNLIATCLRTHGTAKGMSLAEIYKSIRDLFPYYQYCADGWQSSVRHNLSLNKAFRKVSKEGKGWLWGLDEEYCAEKERAKKKQIAAAAAKAKAAALKLEQQQQIQTQRLEQQKLHGDQTGQSNLENSQNQASQQLLGLNLQHLSLPDLSNLSAHGLQGQQLLNTLNHGTSSGSGPLNLPLDVNNQKLNSPLQPNALSAQLQLSPQVQATLLQQLQQNIQLRGLAGFPPGTNISSQALIDAQAKLLAGQFPLQSLPQQPQQPRPDPSQIPVFKSSKSVQSMQPAQAAQPVQPAQTSQTAQTSQPVQPVQPISTGQPSQPVQSAQPIPATHSVQPPQAPSVIPSAQEQIVQPQQTFLQNTQHQQSNKTPSIQAQLAANRGVSSLGSTNPPRVTPNPVSSSASSNKPLGANTKKALAHLQQQLVLLSKDLRTLVDKPTISAILTQAIAMTIAQVTQAAKTKGLTTDPLATLIETNPNQLTRILTVALNAATFKVTNGRIKNPIALAPSASNCNSSSRASTPAPTKTKTSVPQIPKFTSNVHPQPSGVQPNIQTQPYVQQNQNMNQQMDQQLQQVTQPTPTFKGQSNVQQSQIAQTTPHQGPSSLGQLNKGNTERSTPSATREPVQTTGVATVASNQSANTLTSVGLTSEGSTSNRDTPLADHDLRDNSSNVSLVSPNAAAGDVSQSQFTQHIPTHNNAVLASSIRSLEPLKHESEQESHVSSVDPASSSSVKDTTPMIASKDISSDLTEDTSKKPVEITEASASNIQAENEAALANSDFTANSTSTTPVVDSSNTSSVVAVATTIKDENASTEIKYELNREQPQEGGSFTKNTSASLSNSKSFDGLDRQEKHEAQEVRQSLTSIDESLKFLEEDLNDPEFSKVLESLSKEGTPDVEDPHVMNDDELNRLLSSDFPEINTPTTSSTKRTLDEMDIPDDAESNKLQRI